jgi:hypothetical protein
VPRSCIAKAAVLALLGVILALAVAGGTIGVARACGGFFTRKVSAEPRRPSLSYERTLIVFDRVKQREHFVREVVFENAKEPFGFVVPTPSRPEVAAMKSPFDSLESTFPFETLGLGLLGTRGGGAAPAKGAVRVLETKRVGSFTSFVLAADDGGALAKWLAQNGLTTTKETERWLARYVKLRFFFVAMRYEPPRAEHGKANGTRAETVRLSFDTPLAYYPYFEPDPLSGAPPAGPRMLELWYASQGRAVPVAARSTGGAVSWVRPLEAGRRVSTTADTLLERGFGPARELLPEPPVLIERFIDQKRSRAGFGDIVFVPDAPGTPSIEPLRRFFPLLDPALDVEAPP